MNSVTGNYFDTINTITAPCGEATLQAGMELTMV